MEARPQGGGRQSDGFAPQPQGAFLAERPGELGRAAPDEQVVFVPQEEAPVLSHSARLSQVRQLLVARPPGCRVAPVPAGETALQVLVCPLKEQRRAAPQAELRLAPQLARQQDAGPRPQGRAPMGQRPALQKAAMAPPVAVRLRPEHQMALA